MTTRVTWDQSAESVGEQPAIRFQLMQVEWEGAALGAAATDETRFSGEGFTVMTIEMKPTALTAEDYPVLARIWDNPEDERAFDNL